MGKLSQFWANIGNAAHAVKDLKNAIDNKDAHAATRAIRHAMPNREFYEDQIIRTIGAYSTKPDASPTLLKAMRKAVYDHFDSKIIGHGIFEQPDKALQDKTGYKNPAQIYAIAAYMNDVDKLKELGSKGITPDMASDSRGVTENVVSGTANMMLYDAMKELIRQNASLDKGYGYDEFPPIHGFGQRLFHDLTPGVTQALLETGKKEIIDAVRKAMGPDFKPPHNPMRFDMAA
ncbi:MAG: hypothetical protein H6867_08565 [Rhodospirillales bacterium]|nr:hypothetical protein [Rhodospirillales bacterium]MCB9995606.1 hypothetical protein [Rhodospirillales bacterium]